MKLQRKLLIQGQPYTLVDEDIRLDLNAPGRAAITIKAASLPANARLLEYQLGYAQTPRMHRLFYGFIEKAQPVDNNRLKLFARELSASLRWPLPTNLQNTTLRQTLANITQQTGLTFSVLDAEYTTRPIPKVYNLGNGYQLLDGLGRVLALPGFIWQQQPNNKIYVGDYIDSHHATINIDLPEHITTAHKANQSVQIPAIPALRPGMRINGQRVQRLHFTHHTMDIQWNKPSDN